MDDKEPKIIGKSPLVRKLLEFIKKAAMSDANVLLLGDTGVGKELAARMIHLYSERNNKQFIKVNCANLNENLLESELFGYKRGAYTGAVIDKPGLIEESNGGTFFLDEISDITPYIQAKLLSIIEEKKLRRLGENKFRKIDVRFVFATNKDLYKLVTIEKFREDLYYRINILKFFILPLRERKEDIPMLTQNILKEENVKHNKNKIISQEALNELLKYHYPGNIRELNNIIIRAFTMSNNMEIKKKDIIFEENKSLDKIRKLKVTTEMIKQALKDCKGNKTRASQKLGISRQWLYKLMNKKKT